MHERESATIAENSVCLRRKNILLIQPSLQPLGGGNSVAQWMLEALKNDYAVSVLTYRPVDLAAINRHYGTALTPADFTVHPLSFSWLYRLLERIPLPLSLIKTSLLLRQSRQLRATYDLLLSANDETDFGRRGVQYVHYPWGYKPLPKEELRWYHGSATIVGAYFRLCIRLSRFSFDRMKQNMTLVNSDWTGEKVRERHGIAALTLYPPAPGDFPDIAWKEKEDGFVCIGRIAPEKELDKIIDIIAAVRARGHAVHLHIIGASYHPVYHRHIRQRTSRNAGWLFLHEDVTREELVQLVAHHRYGIHGMTEEHFGMAVAEMVRGGCIVFVPHGGGQIEIVGNEEQLVYLNVDDAVEKTVHVLDNADAQTTLHAYLATRKQLFSAEHFVRRLQEIVREVSAPPRHGRPGGGANPEH